LVLFLLGLAVVSWTYFDSFRSIVEKWIGDAAFSHGFLILPLAAWLAWRERSKLAGVVFQPSIWGALATISCALVWVVAKGSGILVIEQFAAVALIPSLVLAAGGWPLVRILWFPLLFLFFAVPFGRALVPPLMQITADFATVLLQWSGVPVFRSHMLISIPAGDFEVARACSGLNYLITSFVLGVLYAYLNFHGWRKRLICVAAFVVIPVVLNGLRVYITILVSHWTDMRFGPGYEHVTFGRIFFVVIIVLLFWVGRRWHDLDEPPHPATSGRGPDAAVSLASPWLASWPLVLACVAALAGPLLLQASIRGASAELADTTRLVRLPVSIAPWQGPRNANGGDWRPLYHGGLVEKQASYGAPDGGSVDVFVAVYGLGRTQGAEMISHNNILTNKDRKSLASERKRRIGGNGHEITVRDLTLDDGGKPRRVWYWYMVGDQAVTGALAAKALEAAMVVTRGASSERIVVISTPADESAAERLADFVGHHAACVTGGFQGEACGP